MAVNRVDSVGKYSSSTEIVLVVLSIMRRIEPKTDAVDDCMSLNAGICGRKNRGLWDVKQICDQLCQFM